MITLKDFYDRWEGLESKLIEMTASPLLAISTLAEHHLQELYQLKGELDVMQFEPDRQIRGIRTDLFGIVSFEDIERFALGYWVISSQKYLLNNGATFSPNI